MKLSPAYDLLPSGGFNGYHTTTVNNNGEPSLNDMLVVAETVGLNKQRASSMIKEVNETVKHRNR